MRKIQQELAVPMTVLALDTALGACSVAVSRGEALLASRFQLLKRGHAEALMAMIDTVCQEAGMALGDIDLFAATLGPGTFTGVRIGLSAARGLALALDRPLVGYSTLEVMAWAALPLLTPGANLLVVHDAHREEVYVQLFKAGSDNSLVTVLPPVLSGLSDLAGYLSSGPIVEPVWLVGSGAELVASISPQGFKSSLLEGGPVNPDAAVLALLAGRNFLPGEGAAAMRGYFDQPAVLPLYLRAPDAKLPGGASL
jgi:tRNA threonylcarbamoyladenosine biosynthesis protein TsaB